jgi:hypothetical protein
MLRGRLLRDDPAKYARVISHVASLAAAPEVFARRLQSGPAPVPREPLVKLVLDLTGATAGIQVYEL